MLWEQLMLNLLREFLTKVLKIKIKIQTQSAEELFPHKSFIRFRLVFGSIKSIDVSGRIK